MIRACASYRGKVLPIQNIGLAGKAGSGKGVLAAELVKRGYEVVSFATPVKLAVGELIFKEFGWDYRGCCGKPSDCPEACTQPLEYVQAHKAALRPLLQACGDTLRNVGSPDHWIRIALDYTTVHNAKGKPVVIDDVRYPNEVEALKAAGFTIFRIDRTPWHRQRFGGVTLEGDQATHSSEAQIEGLRVDWVLQNDADPQVLFNRLAYAVNGDWLARGADYAEIYRGITRG